MPEQIFLNKDRYRNATPIGIEFPSLSRKGL